MGNGGSAAIADHLACDCGKGTSYDTHMSAVVHSLPSNVAMLTAIANDIGYEQVFAFQIQQLPPNKGLVIAISSSGNSPNIIAGLRAAMLRDIPTIAMVGFDGGKVCREILGEVIIHVPWHNYGIVEDAHQSIMHVLSQTIKINNQKHPPTL
jgi:phosphoheptose isomerase